MLPIIITTFDEQRVAAFTGNLRSGEANRNANGTWSISVSTNGLIVTNVATNRATATEYLLAQLVTD